MISSRGYVVHFSLTLNLIVTYVLASITYEGGTVISFNETSNSLHILENSSVLIEGNTITRIAGPDDSFRIHANTIRIDATGKIISPGFIDAHHNLWQTAFRSIASNTTLPEYFQRYGEFSPAMQHFSPEDIRLGYLMGIFEMQHQGTTTVLDAAHATWSDEYVDAAVDATFEGRMRSYFAYTVHPLDSGYSWDDQLSKIRSLTREERFRSGDSLVRLGLTYDYFNLAPAANVSALWDLVTEQNLALVTTHYVAGPWGESNSPEVFDRYGWLNSSVPVVFSHGSFSTDKHAELLRQHSQYICSTPESGFHYGQVNPDAASIQDQAALGIIRHPQRAGALALRRPDLGAIKVGAKADIVVFRTDSPNMIGASDPIAAIILHSDTGDIEDVLVDGKFVKRNGKLTHPKYDRMRALFVESARRIQRIWAHTDWEPLENFDSGFSAPLEEVPEIDTERGPGTGY